MSDALTEFPRYDAPAARQAAGHFQVQLRELSDAASPSEWREAIPLAEELIERAQRVLLYAVALDRARGRSWEGIGADLGISRQAAHERFAHRLGEQLPVIRALADQGRGEGEDVQSIERTQEHIERSVAPDPD